MGIQISELRQLSVLAVLFYESRVRSVENMAALIRGNLENLTSTRYGLEKEIKDSFASNESVRRKDFDCLINELFGGQDERQRQIGLLFRTYLKKQKEAATLIKKILSGEEPGGAGDFEKTLMHIHLAHRELEIEICELLKMFQNEQAEDFNSLRDLLNKQGRRFPEFKEMLKEMAAKQEAGIELAKQLAEKARNENYGACLQFEEAHT